MSDWGQKNISLGGFIFRLALIPIILPLPILHPFWKSIILIYISEFFDCSFPRIAGVEPACGNMWRRGGIRKSSWFYHVGDKLVDTTSYFALTGHLTWVQPVAPEVATALWIMLLWRIAGVVLSFVTHQSWWLVPFIDLPSLAIPIATVTQPDLFFSSIPVIIVIKLFWEHFLHGVGRYPKRLNQSRR